MRNVTVVKDILGAAAFTFAVLVFSFLAVAILWIAAESGVPV